MTEVEAATILGTSWPKEFPELKELDELLKCQICYEYMQTTLISACSHSFCSICIRRYLQYQNQCPTCFAQLFDNQLRNNRVVDSVVQVYTKVKDKLCHHLRISSVVIPSTSSSSKDNTYASPSTSSRKDEPTKIQVKVDVSQSKDANSTKPKKRILDFEKSVTTPKRATSKSLDEIEIIEPDVTDCPHQASNVSSTPVCLTSPSVSKIRVPDMFTTSPKAFGSSSSLVPVSTVPCPVCGVDIPESNINLHLDKCLMRASGQQPPPPKIENKMKRLPKLVYTLLSDKDLKKKAKEYGLNVLGDRKALISRLKRYTVLYNSECDKAVPRSLIEILHDVEKEEKLEQRANAQVEKPTALFSSITRNSDQKVINETNEKYIKENESTFKALIQKMKDRDGANIRPTGHVNRIFDDVDMFESGDDCIEADAEPREVNKTVDESRELNRTKVESVQTPKRSSSGRLPNQLFNGEKILSPNSLVVSLKRLPDHKLPGSSLSSLNQNFLGSEEEDEPADDPEDTHNESNQSFSLLDESQLDFPIDPDSNPKSLSHQASGSTPALPELPEDDDSASSVELFVSSSRQRKRKEMASSPAPSSETVTRKLRKRVDR